MTPALLLALTCGVVVAFGLGWRRALSLVGGQARSLHSRPSYYGAFVAIWCGLPSLLLIAAWSLFSAGVADWMVLGEAPAEVRAQSSERIDLFLRDVRKLADGVPSTGATSAAVEAGAVRLAAIREYSSLLLLGLVTSIATGGLAFARSRIAPDFRARVRVEAIVNRALLVSSCLAILVTVGIVMSLVFEAWRFFSLVPIDEFLFRLRWSPQTALRPDQIGSSGAFGAVPVFWGTLMITSIAMVVAVPVGLFAAVYLAEYASARFRAWAKPLLEILAGIPTVVYGFFAALTVGPVLRRFGESFGMQIASESALAAGAVMGVMIIPFVSSLSDDVITAVPNSLREGSYGLGATRSETILQVVLPAALPGIVASVLLAVSRAVGETMIVVMAAGLSAKLTVNPFEAVTTVTVQIVTLLVGDQEFDSAKTLAAFALGLVLFIVTLILNVVALLVVRRYREQYD